jgi:DNA-binding transcriptional ArsR family regulator
MALADWKNVAIIRAVAHPKRIELLELLAQGERGDGLARATAMGVTNASNHLQVLRHARLVETRKDGTRVLYRLAGDAAGGPSRCRRTMI